MYKPTTRFILKKTAQVDNKVVSHTLNKIPHVKIVKNMYQYVIRNIKKNPQLKEKYVKLVPTINHTVKQQTRASLRKPWLYKNFRVVSNNRFQQKRFYHRSRFGFDAHKRNLQNPNSEGYPKVGTEVVVAGITIFSVALWAYYTYGRRIVPMEGLSNAQKDYSFDETKLPGKKYVSRPELEKSISEAINNISRQGNQYLVIFGEEGSGKRTVLKKVLQARKGIFVCEINDKIKSGDIAWNLLREMGVERNATTSNNPMPYILDLCMNLVRADQKPTIIFDIDKSASKEQINAVTNVCNNITGEYGSCIIHLDLADASIIEDSTKFKKIKVPNFTADEARKFIKNIDPNADAEKIIKETGTNPLNELHAMIPETLLGSGIGTSKLKTQ